MRNIGHAENGDRVFTLTRAYLCSGAYTTIMKTRFTLFVSFSLWLGAAVWAPPMPSDPIGENLFPPDLVLQQQRAIALSTEQRDFIQGAIHKAQPHLQEAEQRVR